MAPTGFSSRLQQQRAQLSTSSALNQNARAGVYHRGLTNKLTALSASAPLSSRGSATPLPSSGSVARNVPRPVQTSSLKKENGGQDITAVLVNRHGGKKVGWGSAVPSPATTPVSLGPTPADLSSASADRTDPVSVTENGVGSTAQHSRQPPDQSPRNRNIPWALHPPGNPPSSSLGNSPAPSRRESSSTESNGSVFRELQQEKGEESLQQDQHKRDFHDHQSSIPRSGERQLQRRFGGGDGYGDDGRHGDRYQRRFPGGSKNDGSLDGPRSQRDYEPRGDNWDYRRDREYRSDRNFRDWDSRDNRGGYDAPPRGDYRDRERGYFEHSRGGYYGDRRSSGPYDYRRYSSYGSRGRMFRNEGLRNDSRRWNEDYYGHRGRSESVERNFRDSNRRFIDDDLSDHRNSEKDGRFEGNERMRELGYRREHDHYNGRMSGSHHQPRPVSWSRSETSERDRLYQPPQKSEDDVVIQAIRDRDASESRAFDEANNQFEDNKSEHKLQQASEDGNTGTRHVKSVGDPVTILRNNNQASGEASGDEAPRNGKLDGDLLNSGVESKNGINESHRPRESKHSNSNSGGQETSQPQSQPVVRSNIAEVTDYQRGNDERLQVKHSDPVSDNKEVINEGMSELKTEKPKEICYEVGGPKNDSSTLKLDEEQLRYEQQQKILRQVAAQRSSSIVKRDTTTSSLFDRNETLKEEKSVTLDSLNQSGSAKRFEQAKSDKRGEFASSLKRVKTVKRGESPGMSARNVVAKEEDTFMVKKAKTVENVEAARCVEEGEISSASCERPIQRKGLDKASKSEEITEKKASSQAQTKGRESYAVVKRDGINAARPLLEGNKGEHDSPMRKGFPKTLVKKDEPTRTMTEFETDELTSPAQDEHSSHQKGDILSVPFKKGDSLSCMKKIEPASYDEKVKSSSAGFEEVEPSSVQNVESAAAEKVESATTEKIEPLSIEEIESSPVNKAKHVLAVEKVGCSSPPKKQDCKVSPLPAGEDTKSSVSKRVAPVPSTTKRETTQNVKQRGELLPSTGRDGCASSSKKRPEHTQRTTRRNSHKITPSNRSSERDLGKEKQYKDAHDRTHSKAHKSQSVPSKNVAHETAKEETKKHRKVTMNPTDKVVKSDDSLKEKGSVFNSIKKQEKRVSDKLLDSSKQTDVPKQKGLSHGESQPKVKQFIPAPPPLVSAWTAGPPPSIINSRPVLASSDVIAVSKPSVEPSPQNAADGDLISEDGSSVFVGGVQSWLGSLDNKEASWIPPPMETANGQKIICASAKGATSPPETSWNDFLSCDDTSQRDISSNAKSTIIDNENISSPVDVLALAEPSSSNSYVQPKMSNMTSELDGVEALSQIMPGEQVEVKDAGGMKNPPRRRKRRPKSAVSRESSEKKSELRPHKAYKSKKGQRMRKPPIDKPGNKKRHSFSRRSRKVRVTGSQA